MGGGGGSQEVVQTSEPWGPAQVPLVDTLYDMKRLADTPRPQFPGQMFAGISPLEEAGYGAQLNYGLNYLPSLLSAGTGAWGSMLGAPDVANNPYVQGMIDQQADVLNRNLAETIPSIQANMLGVNERLGGSGQGVAEGIAARGTQDALARQMAQTQMGAYQAGLGQQAAGMQMMPQLIQAGRMPGQIATGVGRTMRGEADRYIQEAMQRQAYPYEEPWQRKERFYSGATGIGSMGGRSVGETQLPGESDLANVLGLGMGLLGGMGTIGGMGGLSGIFSNFF